MKLNIVPARTGLIWVQQGIRAFFRQPIALSGLFLMFMAVISMCTIVPIVGGIVALVLIPGATLGMMAASHEASRGRFPMPTILVTAFRAGRGELRSMLVLGALYALGFVLLLGLTAAVDGGKFARLYLVGGRLGPELLDNNAFLGAMWIFALGCLPISLLFWHAPALVHWDRLPPVKSLFFSWVACWRNKGAFTLFGLVWSALLCGGLMLASLLSLALGPVFGAGLMMGAMLVLLAMFFTSLVFTFRDCFSAPSHEQPPAAGQD
jgi:hypothetical protein